MEHHVALFDATSQNQNRLLRDTVTAARFHRYVNTTLYPTVRRDEGDSGSGPAGVPPGNPH